MIVAVSVICLPIISWTIIKLSKTPLSLICSIINTDQFWGCNYQFCLLIVFTICMVLPSLSCLLELHYLISLSYVSAISYVCLCWYFYTYYEMTISLVPELFFVCIMYIMYLYDIFSVILHTFIQWNVHKSYMHQPDI